MSTKDGFRTYWDVVVLKRHLDEMLVKIIPQEGSLRQDLVGRETWIHDAEVFWDESQVKNAGDTGLLALSGYVAEELGWL